MEGLELRFALAAPQGGEFAVNTTTAGDQFLSAATMNSVGDFVVVWDSVGQDLSGHGVFGQRFDRNGNPQGTEFRANSVTAGDQLFPRVAANDQGQFVVVWEGDGPNGRDIFAQRFAADGSPTGNEFRANPTTTADQLTPAVAMNPAGNFVVVWDSFGQDGNLQGIFGQRYDASGSTVGAEFPVNTNTVDAQFFPDVAMAADGSFVAVWESRNQDGSGTGIFAQRFAADGSRVGTEFQVNTVSGGNQSSPSVAVNDLGQFVIAWDTEIPGGHDILVQRFSADGTPLGNTQRINQQNSLSDSRPKLAVDARFNFVVVWDRDPADGNGRGVLGRRFDENGAPLTNEFPINTTTTGNQSFPVVAGTSNGDFVAIWESVGQDGSGLGVFGQRFAVNRPPVVDLNGTDGAGRNFSSTFTEDQGPVSIADVDATVTDEDDATLVSATVILSNPLASESLTADTTGTQLSAAYNDNTGTLALTAAAPQPKTAFEQVLRTITYRNSSQNPIAGQRLVTVVVDDGEDPSEIATSTITVVPVNDPPTVDLNGPLAGNDFTVAVFTEGGPPVRIVATDLAIADLDDTLLASAILEITNLLDGQQESIDVDVAGTQIAKLYDAATGRLTLTTTADQPIADFEQVLRTLRYENRSVAPNVAARQVRVTVDDGDSSSAGVTSTVGVAAINQAPTIDFNAANDPSRQEVNFSAPRGPVTLAAPTFVIDDVDSPTLSQVTVTITNLLDTGQETLAANTAGTNLTATFNAATGVLTIAAATPQPLAAFRQVFATVTYFNGAAAPQLPTRLIQAIARDGLADSQPALANVRLTANVLPIVDFNAANEPDPRTVSFVEGQAPVLLADSDFVLEDPDSGVLARVSVKIQNIQNAGAEFLDADVTGTNIQKTFNVSSGVLELTSTTPQPAADFRRVFATLTYRNTAVDPQGVARRIEATASDGIDVSQPATASVTVTANLRPVIDFNAANEPDPRTVSYLEGQTPVLLADSDFVLDDPDSGVLTRVSVKIQNIQDAGAEFLDADVAGTNLQKSFNVNSGVLELTSTTPQPVADFRRVFATLTYRNTAVDPQPGVRAIEATASDGIDTSAPATAAVNVLANVAPVIDFNAANEPNPHSVNFVEGQGPQLLADSDFVLDDPDSGVLTRVSVKIQNIQDAGAEFLDADVAGINLQKSFNVNSGVLELTSTTPQPVADFRRVFATLTYRNTAVDPQPGVRAIEATTSDGIDTSAPATAAVTVIANLSPVIDFNGANEPNPHTVDFVESQSPILVVDSDFVLADPDGTTLTSLTIRITNIQNPGREELSVSLAGTPLQAGYDAGSGVLTITAAPPRLIEEFRQVFATLTFGITGGDPSDTPRILEAVANDGRDASPPAQARVVIHNNANAAPIIDFNAINELDPELFFREGDPSLSLVETDFVLTDADSPTLSTLSISLQGVLDGAFELLDVDVSGTNLQKSTSVGSVLLSATTPQPIADFRRVFATLTYRNSNVDPHGGLRTVRAVANDGIDASSAATARVTVVPNAPPVVDLNGPQQSGLNTQTTVLDLSRPVSIVPPELSVTDSDDTNLVSATVELVNAPDGDQESIDVNVAGTSLQKERLGRVLTITSPTPQPLAVFESVLRTLTLQNVAAQPTAGTRNVRVIVNDRRDASAEAIAMVQLLLPTASLAGYVYVDANNNGSKDAGEIGLPGVPVSISGTGPATTNTGSDGRYQFQNLIPGTYTITETQPLAFIDGLDTRGTPMSGRVANDRFEEVVLAASTAAQDYNFGERSLRMELVSKKLLLASFSLADFLGGIDIMAGTVRDSNAAAQTAHDPPAASMAEVVERDATELKEGDAESAAWAPVCLDVDGNGVVSPLDVLRVINALNRQDAPGLETLLATDVNGDGVLSPMDALLIINHINAHLTVVGEGELAELPGTAPRRFRR